MLHRYINKIRVYAPSTRQQLISHAFSNRSLLIAVNAEKILHAEEHMTAIINRNLGYPDGIGAVLGLKKKGLKDAIKIPGCELWLDIVGTYYPNKKFYLVGGKDVVIDETVRLLRGEFPGIKIVNYRNGFLGSENERNALIEDVVARRPDVVFVAMGSPQQEMLMEEMARSHPAVYQGLGGSFDVYTGHAVRAPAWWIDHGIEWLYRLLRQPSRITRQIHLVRFLWLLQSGRL